MPQPARFPQQPAQQPPPAAEPSEQREQQPQPEQQDSDESAFVHIPLAPSTLIQSANYNPKTLDLIVQFVGGSGQYAGATYHFFQVDQVAIGGWSRAESSGKYFNANIKGQFEYERMD